MHHMIFCPPVSMVKYGIHPHVLEDATHQWYFTALGHKWNNHFRSSWASWPNDAVNGSVDEIVNRLKDGQIWIIVLYTKITGCIIARWPNRTKYGSLSSTYCKMIILKYGSSSCIQDVLYCKIAKPYQIMGHCPVYRMY